MREEFCCEGGWHLVPQVTDAAVPQRLFADGFEQGNPGAWSQVTP